MTVPRWWWKWGAVAALLVVGILVGVDGRHAPTPVPARAAPSGSMQEADQPSRGPAPVTCGDPLGLPPGEHELLELIAPGQGRITRGTVEHGRIVLHVAVEQGHGSLEPIGWQPVVLAWSEGSCHVLNTPRALSAIVGVVEGWREVERDTAWLTACADDAVCPSVHLEPDGSFFPEVPAGVETTLVVRMTGREGTLDGPSMAVVPRAGQDTVLTMRTPASAGGLGMTVRRDGGTLVVRDVILGTAAGARRRSSSSSAEPTAPNVRWCCLRRCDDSYSVARITDHRLNLHALRRGRRYGLEL